MPKPLKAGGREKSGKNMDQRSRHSGDHLKIFSANPHAVGSHKFGPTALNLPLFQESRASETHGVRATEKQLAPRYSQLSS